MEVIMDVFSDTNPAIPCFTSQLLSEDEVKDVRSRSVETIAKVIRWTVAGILSAIIALPAILSFTDWF
jgi:hypothetical protein